MTTAARFELSFKAAPVGTSVNVYAVGTTTPSTLYTDATAATDAANPTTVDDTGILNFFAVAGDYDLVWSNEGVDYRETITVY